MGFFNWFLNLFRSNLVIMQIAVQEIALMIFKSYPQLKAPFSKAIDDTIKALNNGDVDILKLPQFINIDLTKLPAEQQVILGPVANQMVQDIGAQIVAYFGKAKITTATEQTKTVIQVLGWIKTIAIM